MGYIRNLVRRIIYKMDEHTVLSVAAAQLHQKTFLPFKNFCKGERDIVVCAAGPSLQEYKPIKEAIHIAVNRAFLFDKIVFDFIFVQDMDGIRMVKDDLMRYHPDTCVKFFAQRHYMDQKVIPESYALKCGALRFCCDYYFCGDGFKSNMVLDLENRAIGGMPNVGMSVLQLALYMNPKKLYVVGCDMKGTHFADGNQTKHQLAAEKRQYDNYWDSENKRLLGKWKEIKQFAELYYPDTEIISVNPVGLKGLFVDLYQK